MKRYLLAIASVALLAPQLASAQQGYDPNTDRRGGYQGGYDNRPYDSNRGDYRQGGNIVAGGVVEIHQKLASVDRCRAYRDRGAQMRQRFG